MNYNINSALSELLKKRANNPISKYSKKDNFNIFKVLKIESKEVLICRFLREFLDPYGSHKMGIFPLKQFLNIIGIYVEDNELNYASIELEEGTDENRRIDIVIYVGNKVIPIEVKVWAGDQNAQLADYYNFLFKDLSAKDKIYYLTPNGHFPSKSSLDKLVLGEQVICISFKTDICKWIKILINNNPEEEIKFILNCFEEIIEDMCRENNELDAIYEALSLNDNQEYNTTNEVKLILDCLKHKDEIIRKVQQRMLLKNIKADGYSIEVSPKDDQDFLHALLRIKIEDKVIAWICVDTNLYLICNKLKPQHKNKNWKELDEKPWIYFSPKGIGQKYNLKSPNTDILNDEEIDITELLNDILV